MFTKTVSQPVENKICTVYDSWLREQDKTVWLAQLSDGTLVYQDDERPGRTETAWKTLKRYCLENKLNVSSLRLKFRNEYSCIINTDGGAYFCNAIIGNLYTKRVQNLANIGYVKDDLIYVFQYKTPIVASPNVYTIKLTDTNEDTIIGKRTD